MRRPQPTQLVIDSEGPGYPIKEKPGAWGAGLKVLQGSGRQGGSPSEGKYAAITVLFALLCRHSGTKATVERQLQKG